MPHTYDHGGNVFSISRQMGIAPEELIDFSASINPLGISPLVRKSLICALDSLTHYPDSTHLPLKQALARHHGLKPANFIIGNGSTEIIYHMPVMLPGKRALIISPSFSEYVRALGQQHWEARHFILTPENGFSIDTDRLKLELSTGYDALYLCNPGNPGGTLYPLRVIEQIYSICLAAGTFLVLDEAFMDFCEDASAKQFIIHSDNGIILRSMTKFFGIPGLRLGYAIASPTIAERLDAMGGPWSVNTLALEAGVAALQDQDHNRRTIEFIRQERRGIYEQLDRFPALKPYPSSANFLLVELTGGMTAHELKERLVAMRMLIRDCSSFMGLTRHFFRIAVRTSQENQRLLEGLRRILK